LVVVRGLVAAGKYIMEEWANFVLFLSLLVFGEVLRTHIPLMAEAWELFRKAMLWYIFSGS
jgi:hypothetical protein